jgi:hypothetical protein
MAAAWDFRLIKGTTSFQCNINLAIRIIVTPFTFRELILKNVPAEVENSTFSIVSDLARGHY